MKNLILALLCSLIVLLSSVSSAFADPSGVICMDDNDCVGLTGTPCRRG